MAEGSRQKAESSEVAEVAVLLPAAFCRLPSANGVSMPRVAFLFPGQGAQTVGMAKGLCEALPAARALFDEAAAVLGYDLLAVCATGPADKLNATDVSQPALYVASLAA